MGISRNRSRTHCCPRLVVRRASCAEPATAGRELSPWVLCSLIIILATGFLLFASEALKAYASVPFQVKMLFLFAAMIYHYTIYSRVTRADEAHQSHLWSKVVAIISIALWLGVGIGGRGIGFL